MDAGVVTYGGLELHVSCFSAGVSSVSHGHRLAHIGGVRKSNRLWRLRKDMCARA
jgi:hypothetical protein